MHIESVLTCLSEGERPGSGCCCSASPLPCLLARLGSARFSSVCPSRQPALIKGLGPSFCSVTSERISDAQKRLYKRCWCGGASLRPAASAHAQLGGRQVSLLTGLSTSSDHLLRIVENQIENTHTHTHKLTLLTSELQKLVDTF